MKTIADTQFKEHCLSLLDHLEPEGLVVTRQGKPVARVIPYSARNPRGPNAHLIGSLRDKITVQGDIFTTGTRWNADAES